MIDNFFWKGKKVFLTGHTGFKGSWLSIWLNELGAEVMGYSLNPNMNKSLYYLAELDKEVESVIGDIRDLELLKAAMRSFQPDIVIHMAAQPIVKESYENPVETYAVNVMGTVNVLESIRNCKSVKVFLNITTDKVYENKEWVWGYRENDKLGGYDPYSNSKVCSELVTSSYLQSFFNKEDYINHGVAIATARAGNVIGGGDWTKGRLIPDIIQAIENDSTILIRHPQSIRPWQHVLEALYGYLLLTEKLYKYGTQYNGSWNFGPNKDNCSNVLTVVDKLNEEFGIVVEIESSEFHETNELWIDSAKSNRELNWYPILDFNTTLRMVKEWINLDGTLSFKELCKMQIVKYMESRNNYVSY